VSHKAHSPRVFLSNGLIAKLILIWVVATTFVEDVVVILKLSAVSLGENRPKNK